MGTEIPLVDYTPDENQPTYSFSTTDESIDRAREAFRKVKELTIKLSMIENAAYRLATNIKKNTKAGKRSEKYYNSDLYHFGIFHFQCFGGKRT